MVDGFYDFLNKLMEPLLIRKINRQTGEELFPLDGPPVTCDDIMRLKSAHKTLDLGLLMPSWHLQEKWKLV